MRPNYNQTIYACYLGYITQAIVVNLSPLLFVTFQTDFSVSLERIGLLVTVNFGVQILTDLIAARFIDRIDQRIAAVMAHVMAVLGLILMGVLPFVIDPYAGLVISTVCMAIGGGLIEVLISPIVESCPSEHKAATMSLLHSFYCWGQVAVIVLTTLYFALFGEGTWFLLPIIWALIPALGIVMFARVPLRKLVEEHERIPLKKLFSGNIFLVLLLLMIGSGAAEQAMAQWASLFAEVGLGVSKTMGNLLGPCAFAVLMGISRVFFGVRGDKIKLNNALMLCAALCVVSYLLTVFSKVPLLSLAGCALCGLSVGIMWPGTLSLSAQKYPQGGTAMFAVLALAGDVGCSLGPGVVGVVSSAVERSGLALLSGWFPAADLTEAGLKAGLFCAIGFPLLILLGVAWLRKLRKGGTGA